VREFREAPLSLAEVARLLWAAQGITDPHGRRTAPSAGALYPLEVYVVAGQVQDLAAGIYNYDTERHELSCVGKGDERDRVERAALRQNWVGDAAAVFVIAGVYERLRVKYRERAERYVHIEVGHAVQNLCLQAAALGLGSVVVGAFHDDELAEVLRLPEGESPLCLVPVGRQQG
jgi:SagB-type dehydrogenase family enzyme